MRILLIGCVKSSELFLYKLIDMDAEIVGVITKEQAGFNADYVDLGKICQKHGIDYRYTDNVNDEETKKYIRSKSVDLLLCLGWSRLLDEEVLNTPTIGCIGFHPAKLPYNKGRHPLIWALVLGLQETASTFFLMDATADTGKIISQQRVEIEYEDDAESLYQKVMKVAVKQLVEVIEKIENKTLSFISYQPDAGNVWRKRGKADGRIDWRMSSRGIYNLVRALSKPYVGAHFVYKEKEYKVWKVRELCEEGFENIEPGKIIRVMKNNRFVVKTGDNLVEIIECDDIDIKMGEYL